MIPVQPINPSPMAVLTRPNTTGATIPIEKEIRNLIRHYLPEVSDVRLLGGQADDRHAQQALEDTSPAERLHHFIEERINPAIAAHGGVIRLVGLEAGTAHIRFEGRCVGCAMADVTLRQGVELLVKRAIPEVIDVVDATDHTQSTDPYFKTKKG